MIALAPLRTAVAGMALLDVLVGLSVAAIGFLGAFATALQSSMLVSAAEEEALVCTGLEQRIDQLRTLPWSSLTDGTGVSATVWTARPECLSGITISDETITISGYDLTDGRTLQARWIGTSSPTVSFSTGTESLGSAAAVKVTAAITWNSLRSSRPKTRSIVTVISRGGISKSALP